MILNRVMMSLQARSQNWQSQHFEKTKYGKAMAKLKDSHKGETCVVVGNGPSLRAADLQKLHEKGIVTFATNRIYKIFDQTEWRPTYYVSEDPIILQDIQCEVERIPVEFKFVPIDLKWYKGMEIKGVNYFYLDYNSELNETCGISLDVPHAVRCKGTVAITCIQLAIYMGFSKILLLGVDHNYAKMIDNNGNVVEDKTVKDYFSDQYDDGIKEMLIHDLGSTEKAFVEVEMLSRKLGTFKVFNATRGGRLEVFERVAFDDFINKDRRR